MYSIIKRQNKINILLKQSRVLFHAHDLALLWNIFKKNTLHTSIKRMKQRGVLIPIQRGFYSTISLEKIDPFEIGVSFLHTFSYISTESILAEHGVISQAVYDITLVSSISKKFKIGKRSYVSRKLKNQFLLNDAGIYKRGNVFVASLERAVADMLYFNSKYHFDAENFINWDKVLEIQKKVGYK